MTSKGKKGTSLFRDDFEFSAEPVGGVADDLGWNVNEDVMEMASKRNVRDPLC